MYSTTQYSIVVVCRGKAKTEEWRYASTCFVECCIVSLAGITCHHNYENCIHCNNFTVGDQSANLSNSLWLGININLWTIKDWTNSMSKRWSQSYNPCQCYCTHSHASYLVPLSIDPTFSSLFHTSLLVKVNMVQAHTLLCNVYYWWLLNSICTDGLIEMFWLGLALSLHLPEQNKQRLVYFY